MTTKPKPPGEFKVLALIDAKGHWCSPLLPTDKQFSDELKKRAAQMNEDYPYYAPHRIYVCTVTPGEEVER